MCIYLTYLNVCVELDSCKAELESLRARRAPASFITASQPSHQETIDMMEGEAQAMLNRLKHLSEVSYRR